jgi:hypothetical protein
MSPPAKAPDHIVERLGLRHANETVIRPAFRRVRAGLGIRAGVSAHARMTVATATRIDARGTDGMGAASS